MKILALDTSGLVASAAITEEAVKNMLKNSHFQPPASFLSTTRVTKQGE